MKSKAQRKKDGSEVAFPKNELGEEVLKGILSHQHMVRYGKLSKSNGRGRFQIDLFPLLLVCY